MQIEIIGPVLLAPYIIQMRISGFNQRPSTMYLLAPDVLSFTPFKEEAFQPPSISTAYETLNKAKKNFPEQYNHETYAIKFSLVSLNIKNE